MHQNQFANVCILTKGFAAPAPFPAGMRRFGGEGGPEQAAAPWVVRQAYTGLGCGTNKAGPTVPALSAASRIRRAGVGFAPVSRAALPSVLSNINTTERLYSAILFIDKYVRLRYHLNRQAFEEEGPVIPMQRKCKTGTFFFCLCRYTEHPRPDEYKYTETRWLPL